MIRVRMLVGLAAVLVVAVPAQARAGSFSGTVVARQAQRDTLLVAGAHGVGVTIRGGVQHAAVGQRVRVQGARLRDGTIRLSRLQVLARVHAATLRGTVLRTLTRGTLLASGRSVVLIHRQARRTASAGDHAGLRPGEVAEFRIRFDDDGLVEAGPPATVAEAGGIARIEATIVTLSPFVVALEGVPLTITVPAGMTLPATLVAGQRIELTVQVGGANTFTLVAIDDESNGSPDAQGQEVEVKGLVTSSTTTEVVVNAGGVPFTFVGPPGTTLPVLPIGTYVEVRGVREGATITLTRLRSEDGDGGDGGGSGGDGGGHH